MLQPNSNQIQPQATRLLLPNLNQPNQENHNQGNHSKSLKNQSFQSLSRQSKGPTIGITIQVRGSLYKFEYLLRWLISIFIVLVMIFQISLHPTKLDLNGDFKFEIEISKKAEE